MSALKRFVAGFATSLAEQNREDQKSRAAEEQAMRMQENKLKLDQKYERNYEVEERNGELVKVAYSGEGIEIPALTRKLDPTQAEEYRSKGLVAKANSVKSNDTIQYGASDAAEGRRMDREKHADSLENSRVSRDTQRAYASAAGRRGLDSMSGLDPNTPEGEAVAAQQLMDKMGLDVKAAIAAARKRGEALTLNDMNKAARAAVAASKDANEAEDRFAMVLRQALGTAVEEDL